MLSIRFTLLLSIALFQNPVSNKEGVLIITFSDRAGQKGPNKIGIGNNDNDKH